MSLKQRFSDIGYSSNREVAKLLGISAGTVSIAFNGKSPSTQVKMQNYLALVAETTDTAEVAETTEVAEVAETTEVAEVAETTEVAEVAETTEVAEVADTTKVVETAMVITSEMVVEYTTFKLESNLLSQKESFCLLLLLTGYSTLHLQQVLKFWCLSNDHVTFKYQRVTALCSQNALRRLLLLCRGISFELINPSNFLYATKQTLVKNILEHYNKKTRS
jgi:predicted transcriptional regulator